MTTGSNEDTTALEQLLNNSYGLDGELDQLLGERDRNYRLTCGDGSRYVVKVVDLEESESASDFQIRALLHLQAKGCPVAVPRIIALKSGEFATTLEENGNRHILRVVSYLPGTPLSGIEPEPRFARELGAALATIDLALCDFDHPSDRRDLLWDMQNAGQLRERTSRISDARIRGLVQACLDDFESEVEPRFESLRKQVIHSDLNPANVLTAGDPATVAGIIDFSDMVRAPLIVDVAIGAAYLRSSSDDALALIAPFVAGFHEVLPLEERELDLLYDMVSTRIATTITMTQWRASITGKDDAYLKQAQLSERDAEAFLCRFRNIRPAAFLERIREEISDL